MVSEAPVLPTEPQPLPSSEIVHQDNTVAIFVLLFVETFGSHSAILTRDQWPILGTKHPITLNTFYTR